MWTRILLLSSYHIYFYGLLITWTCLKLFIHCVYVCTFAYMWAHMCECGGLRLTSSMLDIFLDCSPYCLLRWGPSLDLNLAFASALDSQLAPEMPCLPPKDCDYKQAIIPTQLLYGFWIDHFDMCLVSKNFIAYVCIYVHKDNRSVILFLCWVFTWFEYQSNCSLIEWIRHCPFCFYL